MNIKIRFWAKLQIYSDFWEFANEYSNIFGCPKIYEWISKHIRTGEMARIQIRIIFEGHFIRIFEYLNIRAHHCYFIHIAYWTLYTAHRILQTALHTVKAEACMVLFLAGNPGAGAGEEIIWPQIPLHTETWIFYPSPLDILL